LLSLLSAESVDSCRIFNFLDRSIMLRCNGWIGFVFLLLLILERVERGSGSNYELGGNHLLLQCLYRLNYTPIVFLYAQIVFCFLPWIADMAASQPLTKYFNGVD
jgi:hypothetical protein